MKKSDYKNTCFAHLSIACMLMACGALGALGKAMSLPNGAVVTPATCRDLGRDTAKVFRVLLSESPAVPTCVDGIYPHLAMQNDEGECGTGAVVPWAGSLWVVTYGPHCPLGSSDKLYEIKPDLTRIVRAESVGGTPANRMIHRESNQLFIGPYAIDARGNVRVIEPKRMPGRLTATARHTSNPAGKIFTATMDNGLYEIDVKTLAVKTLVRDDNGVDGAIWGGKAMVNFPYPPDWNEAIPNRLPGSHTKGMATGFGKVFVANNGEYDPRSRTDPWIPSGVLGSYDPATRRQQVIRRCQFTDVTTPDGIFGNEHPEMNPIWSLGWDAKSVILAVTTNGETWAYYRLPKASHCYDGAHGWNTEWPRIREAGLGDGNLLATMHGTFWRFPKNFSPATPNGIRPLSTYLKVIGDFCYWKDAPGGGSIVFGCDDHAKSQFMGKRKLKADQPPNVRSTSNLWFVKPEDLTTFGPPSGEGWVWYDEDVKALDVSDPYLWEGYASREFTFVDAAGQPVAHELVHDGDWVRVKALADAKGVKAHFQYGPAKGERGVPPDLKRAPITITDDNGRVFRFPNVNGDTNVICREVATERDLLYAGGIFYEVPAENAGGFAFLRPIALADEPIGSIAVDRGLIVVNGKRMALDSLWKNGTAAAAYWLGRKHFSAVVPYGLSPAEAAKWKLTFADEFDGALIDTNKWYAGYRNGQFEYYQRVGAKHPGAYTSPECCYEISNGTLKLRIDEKSPTRPYVGSSCVSCFMTSDHRYGRDRTEATVMKKFGQKYGWFEMRCRVAKGPGLESAFWLHQVDPLHQEFTPDGKPNKKDGSVEFDIFEAWGTPTNAVRAQMNVHFTKDGHYGMKEPDPNDDFHVFALEWEEGCAKFYYDGKVTKVYRGPTPQREMFVLMALFHYRCLPEHRESELTYPRDFEVDYVRVFQKGK